MLSVEKEGYRLLMIFFLYQKIPVHVPKFYSIYTFVLMYLIITRSQFSSSSFLDAISINTLKE